MGVATLHASDNAFGDMLRRWRGLRRMSQMELALTAEISTRHLSFVETGRARPSRDMVLRLCETLDVPLRDRNGLLLAAGFAQSYRETSLSEPDMALVSRALARILNQQEPYPATVHDRLWNVVSANDAALRLLSFFLGDRLGASGVALNSLQLVFDPGLLRPYIVDWEETARALMLRHQREIAHQPDPEAAAVLASMFDYPGVPKDWLTSDPRESSPPVLTVTLEKDGVRLSWFTTIATFGTPQDITLQEMRIESFFPGDDDTAAWAREAAASG